MAARTKVASASRSHVDGNRSQAASRQARIAPIQAAKFAAMRLCADVLRFDFQRQPAHRTSVLTSGSQEFLAIALQNREYAVNRIDMADKYRTEDNRFQADQILIQYGQQQRFFAGENMIETATIHLRPRQELGDTVAPYPFSQKR